VSENQWAGYSPIGDEFLVETWLKEANKPGLGQTSNADGWRVAFISAVRLRNYERFLREGMEAEIKRIHRERGEDAS
jgi:hypothetical protein